MCHFQKLGLEELKDKYKRQNVLIFFNKLTVRKHFLYKEILRIRLIIKYKKNIFKNLFMKTPLRN